MRGSSSNPGGCQWPRPPSRAAIPVDQQSHGVRLVGGIGDARFQVAGKARAASCRPGLRDRTAPTGSGPVRRPLPGENRNGRRGRRLVRERLGLAGVCGARAARRPWDRPEQKTSRSRAPRARRAAGPPLRHGRDRARATDPLRPAGATAGGRRRPALRRGPRPATRTTDRRRHLFRSRFLVTGAGRVPSPSGRSSYSPAQDRNRWHRATLPGCSLVLAAGGRGFLARLPGPAGCRSRRR
jgi:hypothetical protein